MPLHFKGLRLSMVVTMLELIV